MSLIILIFVFIFLIIGLIGSIFPGIPGPTFSYIGILILHFFTHYKSSMPILFIIGIIVCIVFALDYFIQAFGVKKSGGSMKAILGTFLGFFIGFIFPPIGFILGPFIGAFFAAFIEKKDNKYAFKVALGSFLGFISGSIIKFILTSGLFFYSVYLISSS